MKNCILVLALLFGFCIAEAANPPQIKLWQTVKMQGNAGRIPNREKDGRYSVINYPFMQCYFAEKKSDKPTAAILICGGGGYTTLAPKNDAIPTAELLAKEGISCFVLGYRVPDNRAGAFMDAQRAIRIIRRNAQEWNIDPARVGVLGFSAGAHLSACLSTNYTVPVYSPQDASDKLPTKPDFTILISPAYIADKGTLALSTEINVDGNTPKAFIVQAFDDTAHEASSFGYMLALRKAHVPVDFHYFALGGHTFGFRTKDKPISEWVELLKTWLKYNKISE